MLHVYHSNRLEQLAKSMAQLLRESPVDANSAGAHWLQGELIAVENNGMARWLCMQLAQHSGVAANLDCRLPASFIWSLLRRALPNLPKQSGYDPRVLSWRILQLLLQRDNLPEELAKAIAASDNHGLYALAKKLADCYDQYLLFRPDWILKWQANEDEGLWQADLWRQLRQQDQLPHWLAACQRLAELSKGKQQIDLPPRLFLFGISTLSPSYLQVLEVLAGHSEIHIFVLNPCEEYWSDIVSKKKIAKMELRDSAVLAYSDTGHQLLASLGEQGKEFMDSIQQITDQHQELYTDPGNDSTLHRLQQNILHLKENPSDQPNDESIQIHICHSIRREVEVLHDNLLHMFSQLPDLGSSDVIVMAPDIESYAPYIDAVFANGKQQLPYSIADRGANSDYAATDLLLQLLELPGSRLLANEWLPLLQLPQCAARFGIDSEQIEDLEECVQAAGIRWGMDAEHRKQHGVITGEENTWRHGVQRLLLGYAVGSDMDEYQELPTADIGSEHSRLGGSLCAFLQQLDKWRKDLARPRTLEQWSATLGRLRDDFVDCKLMEQGELRLINNSIDALHNESELAANLDCKIPVTEIRACLMQKLQDAGGASGFMGRGITFCRMVPMRSIPFRVVCIMGMSFDAYPRAHSTPDFDLMLNHHRPGDRSRRNDDRYLFLEAIGAARDRLYLSYVGRNAQDNSVIPPSVLLSELIDSIAQQQGEADSLQTEHRLQAFHAQYFQKDNQQYFSYDQQTEKLAYLHASQKRQDPPFMATLPQAEAATEPESVSCKDLKSFLRHPQRYYLRRQLNIKQPYSSEELQSTEAFAMDSLQQYSFKRSLLQNLGEQQASDQLIRRYRSDGILPLAEPGELLLQQQLAPMQNLIQNLQPEQLQQAQHNDIDDISINITDASLHGELPTDPMLQLYANEPNERDHVDCWLHHLIACIAGHSKVGQCHYLKRDGTIGLDQWQAPENPKQLLQELLKLYRQGCKQPLYYSPRLSHKYCQPMKNDDPQARDNKIMDIWHGNRNVRGLKEDFFLALLWRGRDIQQIIASEQFAGQSQAIFGPIMQHRITP